MVQNEFIQARSERGMAQVYEAHSAGVQVGGTSHDGAVKGDRIPWGPRHDCAEPWAQLGDGGRKA